MASFLSGTFRGTVQQSIPPYIQSLVANNGRGEVGDANSPSVAKAVRKLFTERSEPFHAAPLQHATQHRIQQLVGHATTLAAHGAEAVGFTPIGTGNAVAAAARDETLASAKKLSKTRQTATLVTNVARGFLNPLSIHTIVIACYRNHVIEPAYANDPTLPTEVRNFAKRYIVLLSIGDRFACLGLSFALLAMTAVRVATTALFAVAALFSMIITTLTGTRNNWCRNQLIVQLSQLVGSGVLAAVNFIGIFHLSTRAKMVLETADMFSDRKFLTGVIDTTHLVQGHAK